MLSSKVMLLVRVRGSIGCFALFLSSVSLWQHILFCYVQAANLVPLDLCPASPGLLGDLSLNPGSTVYQEGTCEIVFARTNTMSPRSISRSGSVEIQGGTHSKLGGHSFSGRKLHDCKQREAHAACLVHGGCTVAKVESLFNYLMSNLRWYSSPF